MKKALLIGMFSVLALAPLCSALAQSVSLTQNAKTVEKPSAGVSGPNEKTSPTTGDSNGALRTVISSDPATATPNTTITTTGNDESGLGSKAEAANNLALTEIYKVGVGDVLDIRLLNSPTNRSTLYSVVDGGLIDFPIAGGPISVVGLTTNEIQSRLTAELKRLAVEQRTQVTVGVRQYGSHTVVITGLVGNPGTKTLRREAVPLYVLLAEVQPRLDAARVVILRGSTSQVLELSDSTALNAIIRPGDVINLTLRPQEFYYIAGNISYPGQKSFQPGITLVQAILAAGGLARSNVVELSREGANGMLATTKIKVKEIKSGKIEDPKLQPGDRITVLY
jgi:protein involved in polysaccharide export with SLBB domain